MKTKSKDKSQKEISIPRYQNMLYQSAGEFFLSIYSEDCIPQQDLNISVRRNSHLPALLLNSNESPKIYIEAFIVTIRYYAFNKSA